jgi:hypothetical protein
MPITTFDTHKFVRRLEQAGMKLELAEVQAEVLTEAFNVNLESLVTKDFLESRLAIKFAELESKIDSNQRVFTFTQAIVIAAVVIPYLERLMAL